MNKIFGGVGIILLVGLLLTIWFLAWLFLSSSSMTGDVVYVDNQPIPASEFEPIKDSPFALRNGLLYVWCSQCYFKPIYHAMPPDVSTSTFIVIDGDIARDKNRVYRGQSVIEDADPSTFVLLDDDKAVARDSDGFYNFYLSNKKISNNPDSYKPLPHLGSNFFEVDGVLYRARDVYLGADPRTFNNLQDFFSADSKHVFCKTRIIEGADRSTFVIFKSKGEPGNGLKYDNIVAYGKDARYAYFCGKHMGKIVRIEEVDIESFDATGMEYGHAKDKYREYDLSKVESSGVNDQNFPYKVKLY